MRYPAILAAALLGATVFAVPAAAETVGVKYADLDLSTQAGQAKLERRIDSAAREACGMEVVTGRFTPSTAQRQCLEQTKASVHQQVAETIARGAGRG
jgi:UrcA family protein